MTDDTARNNGGIPPRQARTIRFARRSAIVSTRQSGAWKRLRPALLAAIATLGIAGGQLGLLHWGLNTLTLGVYLLGTLAAIFLAWPALGSVTRASIARTLVQGDSASPPLWVASAGLASAGIAFGRSWFRNPDQSASDIIVFWLFGLLLITVSGSWGTRLPLRAIPRAMRRTWNELRWDREFIILAIAIMLIAFVARVVMLDRFPTIIVSDEGILLGEAQSIREHMVLNPFVTEHYSMPTLYVVMEGLIARLFGTGLASYRLASTLLGMLSVLATLWLGRRLFGRWIALAGAGILALMPLHLWASRDALNNIGDAFAFAFALYFLDRALAGRRRRDALLSGITLGLGFYGYTGARVFPLVLGLIMCAMLVIPIYGRRLPIWHFLRLGFWMLAGFLACAAPLLGYWTARPDDFLARFRPAKALSESAPSLSDRLAVVPDALLYPFFDRHSSQFFRHGGLFFRHDPPFLGWLLVPFVAIGFVCWGVWAIRGLIHSESRHDPVRPRPELLLIPWFVISAAIAQTESMESQRFLSITIVWALAAGTGLVVSVTALGQLVCSNNRLWALALLAAVIGISGWNAHFYFSEDRQESMYGQPGATAIWDIAWRTQQMEHLPRIMLAGSIWMTYEGAGQWTYMVPGLAGLVTDIPAFGNDETQAPAVVPGELVVVGGLRDPAEVCMVQRRNPSALKGEARDRYGTLLYTVFTTGPTLILPTSESPGESTFTQVTSDLCAVGYVQ